MRKSWSNRPIEHIDISRDKRFPLAGWIMFGVGGTAFVLIVIISMSQIIHPMQTHENDATPLVMPGSPSADYHNQ